MYFEPQPKNACLTIQERDENSDGKWVETLGLFSICCEFGLCVVGKKREGHSAVQAPSYHPSHSLTPGSEPKASVLST